MPGPEAVGGRACDQRIVGDGFVAACPAGLGKGDALRPFDLAGLTKTLALELGKFRITANYLMPGAIQTGMTRASFSDENVAAIWAKKSALRRLGQPIDMARSVLLLASDEADFITGHGLVADGGLTLRT